MAAPDRRSGSPKAKTFRPPVSAGGEKLKGQPLPVVVTTDDHTFELDEEALNRILLSKNVRDKKVIIISVAGAFRKGKSFLLDFFLRYLNAEGTDDWLGVDSSPLEGFPWRGGSERDTTGILLWSESFNVKLPNGDEAVILLMDTQGAFDSESTVKDCATVFALSTMISSVQVFNITSNIQEDDLQHLQLFTEYGRLALESDRSNKPFQTLQFLVRDWSYPYQYAYGTAGGDVLLDKRLQVKDGQHPELQQLREHIRSCFQRISCFLMPHPGLKVATSPHFDGRLSEIEPDFKTQLRELVPLLLHPDNLVAKQINGSDVTGRMLVEYFKAYMNIYQGDELPEPKSMLRATAEANNLTAVASAKDCYTREMEKMVGGDKPYVGPDLFEKENTRCEGLALAHFREARKMGGEEFSVEYERQLQAELREMATALAKHNDGKNVFAAARTPAILFAIVVACYILSGIIGFTGLETLANMMSLVMGIALVSLLTWAYARYSGGSALNDASVYIDKAAETIWQTAMGPVCTKIAHGNATRIATEQVLKKRS